MNDSGLVGAGGDVVDALLVHEERLAPPVGGQLIHRDLRSGDLGKSPNAWPREGGGAQRAL